MIISCVLYQVRKLPRTEDIDWVYEKEDWWASALTLIAFVGIVLVMFPGRFYWQKGNFLGIASWFIAAFGVIALNRAKQHNTTTDLLFYIFGKGSVIRLAWFYQETFWPGWLEFQ